MELQFLAIGLSVIIGLGLIAFVASITGALSRQSDHLAQFAEDSDKQLENLKESLTALAAYQTELGGRFSQLAESQAAGQTAVSKSLEERLDSLTKRVNDNLQESSSKTAKSLGELQTRLGIIDQAQKTINELSGNVVGLQQILANKQARGAFGQIRMEDIVRDALPPSAFELQATLENGKRPDCLIKMPMPPGPIVIDAKFPLEAYQALKSADEPAVKKAAERAFRTSTLKHLSDIQERYIIPGETAESALMFLPSEAVYAELHANFPEIVQEGYRRRVWIVSPTTLMATLNTVRAVLKDAQMREQAHVIQKEVGMLVADVDRLQRRVEDLKKHFASAEADIRKIDTSADKISRRSERIETLQIEEDGPAAGLENPASVTDLAENRAEKPNQALN